MLFWHSVDEGQNTAKSIAANVMPFCYVIAFIFLVVAAYYEGTYLYNHYRVLFWIVAGVSVIVISKLWCVCMNWSAKNSATYSNRQ